MTARCVIKLALVFIFPLVSPITGIGAEDDKPSDSILPLKGELKVLTWSSNPTASGSTSLSFPYEVTMELYSQPYPLTEDGGYSPPKGIPAEKVVLAVGEKAEVIDGFSVRAKYKDNWDFEHDEYQTWLKVRIGGREGWLAHVFEQYLYDPVNLVHFNKAFSPLRTAPHIDAEAVHEETTVKKEWALRPNVSEGQIYAKLGNCNGWWAIGRGDAAGWLPATTPGLEVYNATIKWEFDTETGPVYTFFFDTNSEITRIIYSLFYTIHSGRLVDFKFLENPKLTLTTGASELTLTPMELNLYRGVETGIGFYEVILPHPIKRNDITSVTFTVGSEDNRKHITADPRPAWAGQ